MPSLFPRGLLRRTRKSGRGFGFSGGGSETFAQMMKRLLTLAYWPMNEASGNALDKSGHGFDMTFGGGVTQNNVATGIGSEKMPSFNGTGYGSFYSTGLRDTVDFTKGSLVVLFQNSSWQNANERYLINLRGTNYWPYISLPSSSPNGSVLRGYRKSNSGFNGSGRTGLNLVGMTWDTTTGKLIHYSNGRWSNWVSGQTVNAETLSTTYAKVGASYNGDSAKWVGAIGQVGLSTAVISAADMLTLSNKLFPTTRGIFIVGDSKSQNNIWPGLVCNSLETALGGMWIDKPTRYGFGGFDITAMKNQMASAADTATGPAFPLMSETPEKILVNMGTNDARPVTVTSAAIFKADYVAVLDMLRAKWPGVPIYCSHIYRHDAFGGDGGALTATNSGIINGYIDWCVAQYVSGVYAGPADDVFIENGDGGATYLQSDKIHYNDAAQAVVAAAWMTAMGY